MDVTPATLETAHAARSVLPSLLHGRLSQAGIRPVVFGLSTLLSLIFTYFISISIYRISFHPLSKHPGPLLCKLTSVIWEYYFNKGSILMWEADQHQKYGEKVRLGPNRLSFIGPKAWKKKSMDTSTASPRQTLRTWTGLSKTCRAVAYPWPLSPPMAGHAAQRKQFNPAR